MDTTYIDSATSFDTWVDQGDNSHDLTAGATNEPAFNFGDADSEYNPFLRFDGTDDELAFTDPNLIVAWSLEIAFKADSLTNMTLFGRDIDDTNYLRIDNSTQLTLKRGNSTRTIALSETLVIGTWYHLIVTLASNLTATAYLDGSSVGTATLAAAAIALDRIGSKNSEHYFDGDIAVASLWNRTLSSAEVLIQYNAGDFWQVAALAADQWGVETALITGDDSDIDTVGNWVGNGATLTGGYDSGDGGHATTLRIEADGGSNSRAELPQASLSTPTVASKRYRVTFDFKWINAPTADSQVHIGGAFTDDDIDKDASGWTSYISTVVAINNSEPVRIYVNRTGGSVSNELLVDNITLVQIGRLTEWRLAHENAFSPFEFPKGRQLPVNFPIVPRQIVGVAGGGQTVVDDLGDADERWPINVLRVNATVRTNLLGFLQDSTVNYRKNSFFFVEEDASEHEVRLWEPFPLDFPRVPGSLFNISIVVRKEIS